MDNKYSLTLNDIPAFAKQLAQQLKGGEIFALVGPLGAGKTTLVKAVAKEIKIKHRLSSPTFALMHRFEAKLKSGKKILFYHLDLYRVKNFKEAEALGLREFWGRPDIITFIEWGDKIKKHLPAKTRRIKFIN